MIDELHNMRTWVPIPFGPRQCAACCDTQLRLAYCESECLRGRAILGEIPVLDATTYDSVNAPAHLHVTCSTCGFQWIERPAWETEGKSCGE